MDEMKIVLKSEFMRNIVAKAISNAVKKQTGVKPKISVVEVSFVKLDGKYRVSLCADADSDDVNKIIGGLII